VHFVIVVACSIHVKLNDESEEDNSNKTEKDIVSKWSEVSQMSSNLLYGKKLYKSEKLVKQVEDLLSVVNITIEDLTLVVSNGIKIYLVCKSVDQQFGIRRHFKCGTLKEQFDELFKLLSGNTETTVKELKWSIEDNNECLRSLSGQ